MRASVYVPKELRKALKLAEQLGWRVEQRSNCHARWLNPDGVTPAVITSSSPGGARTRQNELADLRRAGLPV